MHLQQHFEIDLMSLLDVVAALFLGQTGGNQQDGRGTSETGLIDLVFIHDEVLIQNGDDDLRQSGTPDVDTSPSEEVGVREDAQGSGSVILITLGNDTG